MVVARALAVGLFIAALCAQAAEPALGKAEIGGSVGVFRATGDGGFTKVTFGGSAAARIGSVTQIFGEFGYVPLESGSMNGNMFGYDYAGSYSSKLYQGLGGVRIHFPVSDKFLPFAFGAGGIGRASASATATVSGVSGTGSSGENAAIVAFGGGVTCVLGKSWGLRPEVRYQRYHFSDGSLGAVMARMGIFFQFGR